MPIDASIPLRVKSSRLGELALQFAQTRNQNKLAQRAENRQNRLLQIQEESSQRKDAERSRQNSLRDVANIYQSTIEPMIEQDGGNIARAMQAVDQFIEQNPDNMPTISALEGVKQQFQQDPASGIKIMQNMVRQARSEKLIGQLPKGDQVNILIRGKEDDGIRSAVENERGQLVDPRSFNLIPGAYKAPRQTETQEGPLTKSGKNKAILEDTDLRISVEQNITNIDDLKGLIARPEFVGGLTGDGLRVANSAIQQMRQLAGIASPIKDGKFDESAAGKDLSPENLSKFRQAAITGDEQKSAVSELSFIIAKSLNPDGKISDADVRQAEVILGGGADVVSRKNALDKLSNRLIRNYNISRRIKGEAGVLPGKFNPLSIDGILNKTTDPASAPQSEQSFDEVGKSVAEDILRSFEK